MTSRSNRRAAERKARKLARRGEERLAQSPASEPVSGFEPVPYPLGSVSESQLLANRQNAQLSTGPKSEEGKSKSSLNAVKTGLTGRTVLLPTDDAAGYQRHIEAYEREFRPVGRRERDLVQSIADSQWRLLRIPSLETGILALGHLEFSNSLEEHDAGLRPGMIEVKTFLKYERQLRNLQLHEARLSRRREKEITELRALQLERQRKEDEARENVKQAAAPAKATAGSELLDPQTNGFEFSNPEIEVHVPGSEESASDVLSALPGYTLALPTNLPDSRQSKAGRLSGSGPRGLDRAREPANWRVLFQLM